MATTKTFKFRDIFSTAEEFKEYCLEIGVGDTSAPEQLTFINFVYNSLLYKFGTVDIAYDTDVEFLMELALVLSDTFQQYFKQIDLINKVYKFDDEEFSRTSDSIVSHAEQNNKKLDDPSQWLGFVGSQDYKQESLSKFQGYVQAIKQMPSYDRKEFTNKYKYLFSTIVTPDLYYYNQKNFLTNGDFNYNETNNNLTIKELIKFFSPDNFGIDDTNRIKLTDNTAIVFADFVINLINKVLFSDETNKESTERLVTNVLDMSRSNKLLEYNNLDERNFDELDNYQIPNSKQLKDKFNTKQELLLRNNFTWIMNNNEIMIFDGPTDFLSNKLFRENNYRDLPTEDKSIIGSIKELSNKINLMNSEINKLENPWKEIELKIINKNLYQSPLLMGHKYKITYSYQDDDNTEELEFAYNKYTSKDILITNKNLTIWIEYLETQFYLNIHFDSNQGKLIKIEERRN